MDVKKTVSPAASIRLTERYDLSIPATAEGDVRRTLQKACEKYDIWPFLVVKGKKGTAVSLLRNPENPQYKYQYKYTEALTGFINYLKMEFVITTIIMVRTPCKVNTSKLPPEIHEICKEKEKQEYSEKESLMLKNLEEDISNFNSHVVQQIKEADYDTPEVEAANKHAIKWQRFNKKCPTKQEETPVYYSNGRQKTCEGQLVLDFSKLKK